MEVEHLQAELSKGEVKIKSKEAEMQRLIDEQVKQRDDAVEKLKKATTNFEAMQNQARENQARYWEGVTTGQRARKCVDRGSGAFSYRT